MMLPCSDVQICAVPEHLFISLCNLVKAIFLSDPCNSVQLKYACHACKSMFRVLLWRSMSGTNQGFSIRSLLQGFSVAS